jgi:hypothetical protein
MKFSTESGSMYEVNPETKQVRRLIGINDPTLRVGTDGRWRTYLELSPVEIGRPVWIIWTADVPLFDGSPSDAVPGTLTSRVTRIEEASEAA